MPDCSFLDCQIDRTNPDAYRKYLAMTPDLNSGSYWANCCGFGGHPCFTDVFTRGNMGASWQGWRRAMSDESAESRFADGTIGFAFAGRATRIPMFCNMIMSPAYDFEGHELWGADNWCHVPRPDPCPDDGTWEVPAGSIWPTYYLGIGNRWQPRATASIGIVDRQRFMHCVGCQSPADVGFRVELLEEVNRQMIMMQIWGGDGNRQAGPYCFSNMCAYLWGAAEQANDPIYTGSHNDCVRGTNPYIWENYNGMAHGATHIGDWIRAKYYCEFKYDNTDVKHGMADPADIEMRNLALAWLEANADINLPGDENAFRQLSSSRRGTRPSPATNADMDQFGGTWNTQRREPWAQLPVVHRGDARLLHNPSVTFEYEWVLCSMSVVLCFALHRIRNYGYHAFPGYGRGWANATYPAIRIIIKMDLGVRIPGFPVDAETAGEVLSLRQSDYDIRCPQVMPFGQDQIVYETPAGLDLVSVPPTYIQWEGDMGPFAVWDERNGSRPTEGSYRPGRGWRDCVAHGTLATYCQLLRFFSSDYNGFHVPGFPSHQDSLDDPDDQVMWGGTVNIEFPNYHNYC